MDIGTIKIGPYKIKTLLAITQAEQEKGLMYVEPPAPAMSFVYSHGKINKFWMSNTKAPLDIIFCYKGKIAQICEGQPYSTKLIGENELSDLVLEMPLGTAATMGLKVGDNIEMECDPTSASKILLAAI